MADVHSLVCWGGVTGKPVTLTVSNPCVVTSTAHGLRNGAGLVFSTTGALPTGLVAGTTYYAKSMADNTFNLYDTAAHAIAGGTTGRITTTGSQSGAHTAKSKAMLDYFAAYSGRWGAAGSEMCYDGLSSWRSARASASPLDTEFCEIGENFTDYITTALALNVPAAAVHIKTAINGVRTPAFHNGILDAGYTLCQSSAGQDCLTLTMNNLVFDGLTVKVASGWYASIVCYITSFAARIQNCVFIGSGGVSSIGSYGRVNPSYAGVKFVQNVVCGCAQGLYISQYIVGVTIAGNTITNCGTGVYPSYLNNIYGRYYNNIVVGNTLNWGTATGQEFATNNFSLSGEAWMVGSGATRGIIATTDFAGFPSDLRPASASSPQVDSGAEYYGINSYDIADSERPNYNNGGAEAYDVGAYEFDHGYGVHPASCVLTLANVVVGSRVHIERQDNGAVYFDDVAASSTVVTPLVVGSGAANDIRIKIRKASSGASYRSFETLATIASGSMSIYISQDPD